MTTPAGLLAARLARDPARPLLTFYDDATGERVELSAATLANWVAKTGNLLQDDLGVGGGARVAVLLPAHWQAAAVLLACWSLGAVVTADPGGADVAVVAEDRLAEAAGAAETVALSLRPLGGRLTAPPPGVVDYAAEVLAHGDAFAPYDAPGDGAPALEAGGRTWTAAELAGTDLPLGARVLSTLAYDTPDGLRLGLLGPLRHGSVVLCRHPDPGALDRRAADERVTHTAGVDVAGLPRLG